MDTIIGIGLDALAYGMLLFIISIGLSVMMGLMRVINLAHGAFAMVGGYIASYAIRQLGLPYVVAVPTAVAATVVVALPLEFLLFRRIYGGAEPLKQVLMTIGIAFAVIGIVNAVFGPTIKPIPLPGPLHGIVDIASHTMAVHRLVLIVAGLVIAAGLWLAVEKSNFGVRLRAAVDNPDMAAALGIRTDRLYLVTFGIAVALAAFGGIAGAELMPIEPTYALRYMVTFLVVVSVGGAGSTTGALVASLIIGLVDTAGRYLFPSYGMFFTYAAVILIVELAPNGLARRSA
ncbi:MAG: branched-chain amino acid ABC transporter permease [Ancalomicrobiaceae bacterium]|nr:branched-chain amino acid ABC transporter permease [Ancalomicrobiaceae bacterium]